MFDPKKLNLDLYNLDEKIPSKEPEKSEVVPLENEKLKEDDILNTLDSSSVKADVELQEKEESKDEVILDENTETKDEVLEDKNNEVSEDANISIEETKKPSIIYDVNINSLTSILELLTDDKYDYVIFEPSDEAIKISFRKNDVDTEIKYIKFPIYSQILVKSKSITKLKVEEINKSQQGKGELKMGGKTYELSSKTTPSGNSEKLFLKLKESTKTVGKKVIKKTPISKILGFLGAVTFISLILGGAFITFVVLNAQTVDDVKFFSSLGINLNDINTFIIKIITVIFSILLFIETVFLIIYLFKFFLTKKENKKKKVATGIIATIFLIITFATASAWMIIDKKVQSLPNWQELAYGDVQIYDNSKLTSKSFDKGGSLISDSTNLIGPITIKYDLSLFQKKETQKGFTIKKFIWDFGDKEVVETLSPVHIKTFNKKGAYDVSLIVEEIDLTGKLIEKKVENIPAINIAYVVKIKETSLNNGGKIVEFDSSNLSELGKIEWYFFDDLSKPIWVGESFKPGKPIFEETLVGMYIRSSSKENEELDKVFVISPEPDSSIDGKISFKQSVLNDLEYELKVENAKNDFGEGYIDEFKWIIGEKTISKKGNIEDSESSSKIKFIFPGYGKHNVKVVLRSTGGKTKQLSIILNIPKKLKIKNPLKIYNNGELMKDIRYDTKVGEYFIDELGIPTKLKLDARLIRSNDLLYSLKKVEWDFGDDGDVDKTGKLAEYEINIEGNDSVSVKYTFAHRKIKDDIIEVSEKIYIEGIKKEALLDLIIEKNSQYAPIVVRFDASKSQIKDEDIVKFIWDFGDGITEQGDSIVPGHKYIKPGDYEIKLKVVTESGKEFFIEKKLILKPKPQSVKISTSLKSAPINQGIDFSSDKSEGQVIGYFWDFGDSNVSVDANPTHSYSKAGTYTVKLKLDFANKNVLEDEMKIEIYEE